MMGQNSMAEEIDSSQESRLRCFYRLWGKGQAIFKKIRVALEHILCKMQINGRILLGGVMIL